MKLTLLLAALFAAVWISCKNEPGTAGQQENAAHEEEHASHEKKDAGDHAGTTSSVLLNNGEKWAANAETTDGINRMIALANEFPANAAPQDYHALRTSLEAEFNMILEKCTMTGEAHNQLHNYLVPMQKLFESLDSADPENCKIALSTLKQHFSEYQNYFK